MADECDPINSQIGRAVHAVSSLRVPAPGLVVLDNHILSFNQLPKRMKKELDL
jgi:hypothetical protein